MNIQNPSLPPPRRNITPPSRNRKGQTAREKLPFLFPDKEGEKGVKTTGNRDVSKVPPANMGGGVSLVAPTIVKEDATVVPFQTIKDCHVVNKHKILIGVFCAVGVLICGILVSMVFWKKSNTTRKYSSEISFERPTAPKDIGHASNKKDVASVIFDSETNFSETQQINTFEGYHSFSGHNGVNVNGEITVNGSEVKGRERYKSSYLPLDGYYNSENGWLEMTEYNGDMVTGTYEGSVKDMVFHGTFTNFKGRTYNATLHFR